MTAALINYEVKDLYNTSGDALTARGRDLELQGDRSRFKSRGKSGGAKSD